jgi:hypothetical protein
MLATHQYVTCYKRILLSFDIVAGESDGSLFAFIYFPLRVVVSHLKSTLPRNLALRSRIHHRLAISSLPLPPNTIYSSSLLLTLHVRVCSPPTRHSFFSCLRWNRPIHDSNRRLSLWRILTSSLCSTLSLRQSHNVSLPSSSWVISFALGSLTSCLWISTG